MNHELLEIKKYPVRWYCLLCFSIITFLECVELVVFNAVPQSTQEYYSDANLSMSDINFILSIGIVGFVIFVFVMMYIDSYFQNFRIITLLATFLLLFSCIIRLIPTWIPALKKSCRPFLIIGSFLNNIGSAFCYSTPSKISATWFPAKERMIATLIGAEANSFGSAVAYLAIPLIVKNGDGIPRILWGLFGVQALITIVVCIYFPGGPSLPPSYSELEKKNKKRTDTSVESGDENSEAGRIMLNSDELSDSENAPEQTLIHTNRCCASFLPLLSDLRCLFLHSPAFLLFFFFTFFFSGACFAWFANVIYFYTTLGFSEDLGGYIAFAGVIGGIGGALLITFVSTRYSSSSSSSPRVRSLLLKTTVLVCTVASAVVLVFFLWLLPLTNGGGEEEVLPILPLHSAGLLSVLVIVFAVLSNAPLPLYYEASAEITYPISEAVSGGIMTAGMSAGYSLVLLVFSYAGVGWMTVIALICTCVGILCLAFVQFNMKREEVEKNGGL